MTGSFEKLDLLEKIRRDNVRANDRKQTINIASGTSSGRGTSAHRSPSSAAGGGGAVIPVYTAAGNRARNQHKGTHHSGGGCGHQRCGRVWILVTTVLISFGVLI